LAQQEGSDHVPLIDNTGNIEWIGKGLKGIFKADGAEWKDGYDGHPSIPPEVTANCEDITIYVSGFQNSKDDMQGNSDIFAEAAGNAGYTGKVVGFAWDSNPGGNNFDMARESANLNGKALANAIDDIRKDCPNIKVNVVTHSLGGRVALKALQCGACIDGCVLTAPAVDNESIEPGNELGPPKELPTGSDSDLGEDWGVGGASTPTVKNWYNPADNVLDWLYQPEEWDQALGDTGIEHKKRKPGNYKECTAYYKMKKVGQQDNHSGYLLTPEVISCIVVSLNGGINQ